MKIKACLRVSKSGVSDLESHANYLQDLSTVPTDITALKEECMNQLLHLKSENTVLKRFDDMKQYSRQTNIDT